jgi:hypothetical protein
MGSDFVVVASPGFGAHLRVGAIPKPLQRQMLVAELAVERFVRAVLPRFARIDASRYASLSIILCVYCD